MAAAGDYRLLMDFEEDVGSKDTSGQQQEDWQPIISGVWCNLTPLNGRELMAAQQTETIVTHRLNTRYNPELTLHPRLRVKVGTRILHIDHIINVDERNRELEMLCTEVQ